MISLTQGEFPVHLTYFTLTASEGRPQSYHDIYGIDAMAAALFGKAEKIDRGQGYVGARSPAAARRMERSRRVPTPSPACSVISVCRRAISPQADAFRSRGSQDRAGHSLQRRIARARHQHEIARPRLLRDTCNKPLLATVDELGLCRALAPISATISAAEKSRVGRAAPP